MADTTRDIIAAMLAGGDALAASEVARRAKISRQMAHRHLTTLVDEGRLVREGRGRNVRYRDAGGLPFVRRFPRAVISEDRVWDEVASQCRAVGALAGPARSLFQYAFTEMLNNAIEHSRGREVEVRFERAEKGVLAFEILDDGIGLFKNLRRVLGFKSDLEALQELSKGKLTTLPQGHTGEGIFFTSKAARRFQISSGGLRWTVDNVIGDMAVGSEPPHKGTRVRFEGDLQPRKTLAETFAEYTEDFALTKTRVVVKLFTIGVRFISRSEARRLLTGLDRFRVVVLDFKGVEEIGQGFADEVFRVWAAAHPQSRVEAVGMSTPVAFMIEHARRS
jgi:hypothetical protein